MTDKKVLWLIVRNQVAIMAALHATLETLEAPPETRERLLVRIDQAVEWLEREAETTAPLPR